MLDTALRRYWHPVTEAASVTDAPRAVTLLGERLVVFRSQGQIACFQDLCIHRGAALSLGWVEDGCLVCPYHGWAYDAAGSCVRIPSLPPEQPIPRKARARRYLAEERYGLIWVCLEEPSTPIPDFPEYGAPGYRTVLCGPYNWKASAPRAIENFVDFAHFAWVHPGILGDRSRTLVQPHEVVRVGNELLFANDLEEPNPDWKAAVSDDAVSRTVTYRYLYRLTMPLAIHARKIGPAGDFVLFFVASPRAARETSGYCFVTRNYALEVPDEEFQRFEDMIFEQDRLVVESQRPEELPLDLSAELHIKPDHVSVEYRRFLADLGIEATPSATVASL